MRAIVRGVSDSFENALASYFGNGPTSLDEARLQHVAYVSKLKEFGLSVKEIESHTDYPDCCFVEDHAVVVGDSALITNAGHDTRLGEKAAVQTALSEDLFRAGSVTNPKGAVAAVGTATTGTHTLFNNIMSMGIFDGIFPKGLNTAGGAVASGRLSLYWTYPTNPGNKVSIFSHWLNLMGDPGLQLWTDTPTYLSAEFNSSVSWGTNFIDVIITDENNQVVENALVTHGVKIGATVLTEILTGSNVFSLPEAWRITLQADGTGTSTITSDKIPLGYVGEPFCVESTINVAGTDMTITAADHGVEKKVPLQPRVCGKCGFVDLFVQDPSNLRITAQDKPINPDYKHRPILESDF